MRFGICQGFVRIALSQLVLLILIGALAWQGISAARTQEKMVRTLLGDYALLIAENAERSFNAALGYRTFYALLNALQAQPERFPLERRPDCLAGSLAAVVVTTRRTSG